MTPALETLALRARRVRRLDATAGMRDSRMVHELDGMLGAVQPDTLLRTGLALWRTWRRHPAFEQTDVLLGLDAGGILPTVAVALASDLPYRLAWKLDLDLPHKHHFSEPHSRRADVFAYGDLAGTRVLLVDDEITTGQTISNLAVVLREAGAHVTGALCLIEDVTGDGRAWLRSQGVPLCTLTRR
jgi:adenine phosphoribosyltransferase